VAGAIPVRDLLEIMTHAGFHRAALIDFTPVATSSTTTGALFCAAKPGTL